MPSKFTPTCVQANKVDCLSLPPLQYLMNLCPDGAGYGAWNIAADISSKTRSALHGGRLRYATFLRVISTAERIYSGDR